MKGCGSERCGVLNLWASPSGLVEGLNPAVLLIGKWLSGAGRGAFNEWKPSAPSSGICGRKVLQVQRYFGVDCIVTYCLRRD